MRQHTRRRFLAGALGVTAAAVAPTLIAGCGAGDSDNGPLKFWNFYGPQEQPDPAIGAQSRWFEKLVADWNATHQRQVELVYVPQSTYLNGAKLPTAFAAGAGPDIFLVSPGDFLRYRNGGVLANLSEYLTKEVVDDFFPDALSTRSDGGNVYALPMEVEPLAMFYNIPAWQQAGLSEGDIPTTWDQMLDVGDKLRTRTRAGLVFETQPGYYQNFTWYPWLWQGGGDVVDEAGRPVFDSDATRSALEMWQTAVREGIAPRTQPAASNLPTAFISDLAGMWQSGIWQLASFRAYAPDFEYGLFPLPAPPGGESTTILGGWAFAANARGRDPQTAVEFCAWALGSTERDCVQRMVEWCTVAKTDIAPRRSVLAAGTEQGGYDFWALKKFKDEIFPTGRAEPRYPPVVYKAVSDAIQACQLGGKNVSEQVDLAARSIDAYLRSYQGASLL